MTLAFFINLHSSDWIVIPQVELASNKNGIFKREWAVLPPVKSWAAIPEDATANAMLDLFDLILANRHLYRNVLPVPPGPSIKNVLLPF